MSHPASKNNKCIFFEGLNVSPKPSPSKCEPFPKDCERASIVQCPTFHPTDDQFKNPLEYIQSISSKAEPYGICKIVPPPSWKVSFALINILVQSSNRSAVDFSGNIK